MEIKDYQGRSIKLFDSSWEQVQESHPEITHENSHLVLIDPLEVWECLRQNFGEALNDVVTTFKSEKNDEIIGYGFEEASQSLFENNLLSPSVKLAALLKIVREKNRSLRSKL